MNKYVVYDIALSANLTIEILLIVTKFLMVNDVINH